MNATEIAAELEAEDILRFKDDKRYRDRLSQAQKQTGEKDALIVMRGTVVGVEMVAVAFEFQLYGRLYGFGRGGKVCARGGYLYRAWITAGLFHRKRGCAYAGRVVLTVANGQDQCVPDPALKQSDDCPTSACLPIQPWAESRPVSPCLATFISVSQAR